MAYSVSIILLIIYLLNVTITTIKADQTDGLQDVNPDLTSLEKRTIHDVDTLDITLHIDGAVHNGNKITMHMDSAVTVEVHYVVKCDVIKANLYFIDVKEYTSDAVQIEPLQLNGSCLYAVGDGGDDGATTNTSTQYENHFYGHEVNETATGYLNVTVKSMIIGAGLITLTFKTHDVNVTMLYDVMVIREVRLIDVIFQVTIYCLEVLEMVGFGTEMDLPTLKKTLKKPVQPAIGFACQYVAMPLIAYAVAKLVNVGHLAALGIFVAGCCPGGGSSNIYAYLSDGDISLSITMTTISTLASLFMMPFWLYTLGSEFLHGNAVTIPFEKILLSLSILIVPLMVGMTLKNKTPKAARLIQKALTPVITVFAICLIVTGIYANLYIFRLFKPRLVLAGCLLPYVGFILGGSLTRLLGQPWSVVKTISLETGFQNTGIGMIMLMMTFPQPMGDVAAVAPIAAEVMSPLPVFFVTFVYLIYKRWCSNNYKNVKTKEEEAINGETT